MLRLLDYAVKVAALVRENPQHVSELAESLVALVVARLDAFLTSVVSVGTRHREQEIRRHFAKHGHENARTCDLPTLVKLVRRRVSFEDGAKRLDNLFNLLFQCSLWPSETVRDLVLDLVLLRNFMIHSDGQDWSQDGVSPPAYASQFRRADVLTIRRYGDFVTYSVDHYMALLFARDAGEAIVQQAKYLEQHLSVSHETRVPSRPQPA
jgi:hypothetical protein